MENIGSNLIKLDQIESKWIIWVQSSSNLINLIRVAQTCPKHGLDKRGLEKHGLDIHGLVNHGLDMVLIFILKQPTRGLGLTFNLVLHCGFPINLRL